jgi:LppP/LprE lipoprotein
VLIGTKDRSAGAFDQQAFFFVNGRFIGTDSSQPSATVSVLAQSDTEVTLAYPLYRSGDPVCCPSAGQAHVSFQLNNGKLAAVEAIPPVRSTTGLSRM